MRTGILGGTFNPPHLGHLHAAELAHRALNLDRVLFIPTNIPPHKALPENTASADEAIAILYANGLFFIKYCKSFNGTLSPACILAAILLQIFNIFTAFFVLLNICTSGEEHASFSACSSSLILFRA